MQGKKGFFRIVLLSLITIYVFLLMSSDLFSEDFSYDQYLYNCFYNAANYYNVNLEVLMSIAWVESRFNPRAYNKNKNKSYDIGIMQINSSWFSYLKKFGIDIEHLWNPCYNIHIGAMILRHCLDTYGNSWRAIDCYNKGKRARSHSQYVWKVYKALNQVRNSFAQNDNLSSQTEVRNNTMQAGNLSSWLVEWLNSKINS